jgi:hypothetical protein
MLAVWIVWGGDALQGSRPVQTASAKMSGAGDIGCCCGSFSAVSTVWALVNAGIGSSRAALPEECLCHHFLIAPSAFCKIKRTDMWFQALVSLMGCSQVGQDGAQVALRRRVGHHAE